MVRSLRLMNILTCGRARWCVQQARSSGALNEYLLTTLAHLSSALVSLCECLAVTIWSGYLPSSGFAGARAAPQSTHTTVLQEWLAETLGYLNTYMQELSDLFISLGLTSDPIL